MDKTAIIKRIIESSNGIAKTSDLIAAGLSAADISEICGSGYIERIRHGYYRLSGQDIKEEQLLASLLPESVVCVESALFYYGYSDFVPRRWSIAVPRTFSRTKLKTDALAIKTYFIQPAIFGLGKTIGDFNGVRLAVYDRERTVCDCFKYRTKLDSETFNKALNAYATDRNKNLSNLSAYAEKMRIYKKITDIMEILLNN